MFKYLGQHIFDFVSQFRNDVYFKNLTGSSDTTALVVDADGKVHTNTLGNSGDTEAAKVRLPVRFQEAVAKGDPVYISGYNNGQNRAEVAKADCDDFSKMPSFGLADAAYSANDNGFVISIGNLADVDTQAYSVGDTLYVASGGGLTNVKPTVNAKLIQNVGVVTRSQQNSGQIEVVATGRTNDVPWPLYVDVPNSKVGIGTTSPLHPLHVNGNIQQQGTTNSIYMIDGGEIRGTSNVTLRSLGTFIALQSSGSLFFQAGDTERMRIDSATGNVGIGTTSPVGILHTYSTSAPVIESPSNAAMIIRRNDNVGYSSLIKYHSGNSEKFVAGLSDSGDFTDSTGEEYFIGTTKTNPLVVLKNDGKLGIGVTDPERILDVGNTMMVRHATNANRKLVIGWGSMYPLSDTDEFQFLNGGASLSGMRFYGRFHSSSASKGNLFSSTGLMIGKTVGDLPDANTHVTIGGADTDTILLKVRNYSNASIFSVLGSGNVGIGTTTPSEKLDVAGNINTTGNITFDGGAGILNGLRTINRTGEIRINTTQGTRFGETTLSVGGIVDIVGKDDKIPLGIKQEVGTTQNKLATFKDSSGTEVLAITTNGGFETLDSNLVKRFSFGHGYSPSPADGMGIGLDLKTENASGTVVSVGSIDVIQDDVSADLSSMRLSVGETTPTEIMRLKSDGKLGIGTTSPTEKLDVNGNIVLGDGGTGSSLNFNSTDRGTIKVNGSERMRITSAGNVGIGITNPAEKLDVVGNIKASGTIKGKMEQMFACSFSDDLGTTKHYIPFTSNAEQTNVHADQVAMVMPYGGRVKCIQMRLSNIEADTTRTLGIESIAPGVNMFQNAGNWTSEETEAYELVASDDYYLVNYVFSNETHFDSGDLLAISMQDSEDAYTASRQIYVNVIIEYDLNNGMGNDTATTKYTS